MLNINAAAFNIKLKKQRRKFILFIIITCSMLYAGIVCFADSVYTTTSMSLKSKYWRSETNENFIMYYDIGGLLTNAWCSTEVKLPSDMNGYAYAELNGQNGKQAIQSNTRVTNGWIKTDSAKVSSNNYSVKNIHKGYRKYNSNGQTQITWEVQIKQN